MSNTTPLTHPDAASSSPKHGAGALARTAIICAYIATIFVPTGFAKIAIAPIAITLIATIAAPTTRRLWWAAAALAAVYAIPFIQYAINPNRAPSLSKDMDPVWWVIIPIVGVVYIVAYHVSRTSRRR